MSTNSPAAKMHILRQKNGWGGEYICIHNTPLCICNIYSYKKKKKTEHHETTIYIHKIIIRKSHFITTIQFALWRCRKKNGHFDMGHCSDVKTRLLKFNHQQPQLCMLLFTSYLMLHVLASSTKTSSGCPNNQRKLVL